VSLQVIDLLLVLPGWFAGRCKDCRAALDTWP